MSLRRSAKASPRPAVQLLDEFVIGRRTRALWHPGLPTDLAHNSGICNAGLRIFRRPSQRLGGRRNAHPWRGKGEFVMKENLQTATLAGGCFWCLEAVFDELKGVESVESGYSGGHAERPSYREVCSGTTGHAEAVQVHFDPACDFLSGSAQRILRHTRSDHPQPAGRGRGHAVPFGDLLSRRAAEGGRGAADR